MLPAKTKKHAPSRVPREPKNDSAYVQCYKLINRKGKISLFASLEDQIADYQMRFQTTFSNEIPNNIFHNLNAKNCGSPKIK